MGLFRKDSPAEKKLKELTGGFILSTSFSNLIKSKGLEIEDGIKIKNQIKDEIKQAATKQSIKCLREIIAFVLSYLHVLVP